MTGSEDLGQSLRAEMESYLDRRLSALQEDLARLHGEINEAFTRLAERLESERHDPSFGNAFSEHLRDAVGASSSSSGGDAGGVTTDMALIKAAVEDIQGQSTQADVLNTLVNRASSFAPRVAFFVVKNNRATGWRARGLEGTVGDDSIREISLPLSEQNLLSEAVNSRATWSGAPGTNAGDHELLNSFSDELPARIVAVPLIAREKAVAVLYADSAELDGEAINLEALETLVRVSGMAVELRAGGRLAGPMSTAAEPVTAAQSAPAEVPASAPAPAATETAATAAPAEAPAAPVSVTETLAPAAAAPAVEEEKYEPVSATTEQPRSPAPAQPPPPPMPSVPPLPQPSAAAAMPAAAAADPLAQTQTMPAASAPLGTKRRWGQAEAELPVEVSEDERRFHNDARRFARLLVSEIKLYNEQKVKDGRVEGNLYERLREEIDRSRQMYDKRVAANVAERYDYFHNELVGTLAEGDATKLGADYPATASSSG